MGVQASQPHKIIAVSVNGLDPQMTAEKLFYFLTEKCKIRFTKILNFPNEGKLILFFDNYRDLNDGINRLESKEYIDKDLTVLQLSSTPQLLRLYYQAKVLTKEPQVNDSYNLIMPLHNKEYDDIKEIKIAAAIETFKKKFEQTPSFLINYSKFFYISPANQKGYLNYGTFQIGYTEKHKIAVGFEQGSKKKTYIEPVTKAFYCYDQRIHSCIQHFDKLINETGTTPFSSSTSEGLWKSIFIYAHGDESMVHFEVAHPIPKSIKDQINKIFNDVSAITLKLPNQNKCEIILQNDYIMDSICSCKLPVYPLISTPQCVTSFENLINNLIGTQLFNDDHFILNIFSVNAYISTCLASHVDSVYFLSPKNEMEWPKIAVKSNKFKNFNFQKVTNYGDDIEQLFKDNTAEDGIAILEPQDVTRPTIMETVANALIQSRIKNIFIYFQSKQGMKNTLLLFSDNYKIRNCFLIDYFPHSNSFSYMVWLELK